MFVSRHVHLVVPGLSMVHASFLSELKLPVLLEFSNLCLEYVFSQLGTCSAYWGGSVGKTVHTYKWLRLDLVPPSPVLTCDPSMTPGGSCFLSAVGLVGVL